MIALEELDRRVKALEEKVERLSGPHIELVAEAIGPGGQPVEGPHAELVVAEGPPPGQSVTEWISGISGSPGIVVDPGIARMTPCLMYELGPGRKPLVFSKGIVGALDEEQQALYCEAGVEVREPTPKQRQRLEAMKEAAQLCSREAQGVTTQEHLTAYFTCLGRELRAKGEEPW